MNKEEMAPALIPGYHSLNSFLKLLHSNEQFTKDTNKIQSTYYC